MFPMRVNHYWARITPCRAILVMVSVSAVTGRTIQMKCKREPIRLPVMKVSCWQNTVSIPGNLNITNPFNQMYQGIERANLCIYNIPKMELYTNGSATQQAQLKRMYGEALVLRAQYLYELCRNFGDVPVQWQPSQFEADLLKSRTSRDTIYDHLIDDLALAQTLLPWRKECRVYWRCG